MPHPQSQPSPHTALPLLSTTLALLYALTLLAHPPRHRNRALLPLLALVLHAFTHHLGLTPWYVVNDTFARTLYIWAAHVSWVFCVLRVEPPVGERWVWAGKVARGRYVGEYWSPPLVDRGGGSRTEGTKTGMGMLKPRREPPHTLSRLRFCALHLAKALLFTTLTCAYDTYMPASTTYPPSPFIRRIPSSLAQRELALRASMTADVCIIDMLFFSSLYSVFALLCVGLHIDEPGEWSLSLFGSLADASSVRAYWGVYWHDLISGSFAGHGKVFTRGVLGMRKGMVRSGVENGIVFVVSGAMHAAVRWVQTGGQGECWTVAMWYGAQILPIVVEEMVGGVWAASGARRWVTAWTGEKLGAWERAVGYVWVAGWMFWSVPKYLLTRHEWELEGLRRRYPEVFAKRE